MTASAGNKPHTPETTPAPATEAPSVARVPSESLFAGKTEVVITHGGEAYRLRLTRQNRLILTK